MHLDLYIPMWFAGTMYVIFGLIGLCWLAIGIIKALAWAGIRGPHGKPNKPYCGYDRFGYDTETHEEYHARLRGIIVNLENEEPYDWSVHER